LLLECLLLHIYEEEGEPVEEVQPGAEQCPGGPATDGKHEKQGANPELLRTKQSSLSSVELL
jgi:hypothetical protein